MGCSYSSSSSFSSSILNSNNLLFNLIPLFSFNEFYSIEFLSSGCYGNVFKANHLILGLKYSFYLSFL